MNLDEALAILAVNPAAPLDLAGLALALARDEYTALDVEAYLGELAGMAREARAYVRGSPEAKVEGLCRYLFHEMGFRGNARDYYDPRNSYFNDVLDRRTGIPISLSLLAMTVAERVGLTVHGIGLPGHFVACADVGGRSILFDPFHGGRRLQASDCEILVKQVTGLSFHATPATLRPVPAGQIVQRMLMNLKGVYLRTSDYSRAVRVIERLRQLTPNDPMQQRDLGASLLQAGRHGQAIDHLSAYLAACPKAEDVENVRCLLDAAQGEIARWN